MSQRIRPSGPKGVVRPSVPSQVSANSIDQLADAVDRIAVSLAAIDHNLEVLVSEVKRLRKQ